MKGAPWFKFFPADFLGGVAELSSEERGSYITLLCVQWQSGSLPSELDRLERLAGGPVSALVLAKFKAGSDGRLRNDRLESHREEATAKSRQAADAAEKRWQSERTSENDAGAMRTHSERNATAYASAYAEARGQRLEFRDQNTDTREQKKESSEACASTSSRKARPEIIQVQMPAGFESISDLFSDWAKSRGTGSSRLTERAAKIALNRIQSWGLDKSRFILESAIIGKWQGLEDYGHYDKQRISAQQPTRAAIPNQSSAEPDKSAFPPVPQRLIDMRNPSHPEHRHLVRDLNREVEATVEPKMPEHMRRRRLENPDDVLNNEEIQRFNAIRRPIWNALQAHWAEQLDVKGFEAEQAKELEELKKKQAKQ